MNRVIAAHLKVKINDKFVIGLSEVEPKDMSNAATVTNMSTTGTSKGQAEGKSANSSCMTSR